jgi:hypothetical protein
MIVMFIVQQNPYNDFTVEAAKTQGKKTGHRLFRTMPCRSCFFIRE